MAREGIILRLSSATVYICANTYCIKYTNCSLLEVESSYDASRRSFNFRSTDHLLSRLMSPALQAPEPESASDARIIFNQEIPKGNYRLILPDPDPSSVLEVWLIYSTGTRCTEAKNNITGRHAVTVSGQVASKRNVQLQDCSSTFAS